MRPRLVIRSPGRIRLVDVEDVDRVEAAGNYVLVHVGRDTHLLRETLTDLEERLDPGRFLRIHRSVVVNVDRVREVRLAPSGDARVHLADGSVVPLSRRYRGRFEAFLEGAGATPPRGAADGNYAERPQSPHSGNETTRGIV